MKYNEEIFKKDLKRKALCEMCPQDKTYIATKIAIVKRENVVIVQQICDKCCSILREGFEGWEDMIVKVTLLNFYFCAF